MALRFSRRASVRRVVPAVVVDHHDLVVVALRDRPERVLERLGGVVGGHHDHDLLLARQPSPGSGSCSWNAYLSLAGARARRRPARGSSVIVSRTWCSTTCWSAASSCSRARAVSARAWWERRWRSPRATAASASCSSRSTPRGTPKPRVTSAPGRWARGIASCCPASAPSTSTRRAVMDEYVQRTVLVDFLARKILESPVYQRFFAAAPGLPELMVHGQGHDRSRRNARAGAAGRRYDLVILDAPATGHGLAFLKVPLVASQAVPVGPGRPQRAPRAGAAARRRADGARPGRDPRGDGRRRGAGVPARRRGRARHRCRRRSS